MDRSNAGTDSRAQLPSTSGGIADSLGARHREAHIVNVLVLTTMTPFEHGRAEEVTDQLIRHMKLLGVNAEAMRLPYKGHPTERLLDEMFIFKSLKLFNVDRVISLGFPAYL